jgi:predicted ribosome quality control (RQC) complex YloA/Tae2 family protein
MKEYTCPDGNTVKVGKNAIENDKLVDNADKEHYWFHLSKFVSCHAILESDDPSKSSKQFAAEKVKENSKYGSFKGLKVDCIQVKHIKQENTPGLVSLLKKPQIIKC